MSVESRQRPKKTATFQEGDEAATNFERSLQQILTVTKEEIARREAAYQQERSTKDRPGPKRGSHRKTA